MKPPEAAKAKESQLVTLLRLSQIRLRSHYLTTKDIFAPDLRTPPHTRSRTRTTAHTRAADR